MQMELALDKYSTSFNLEKAVCNHGFFMMAPNRWMPSTKQLIRPLRLADHQSVMVSISQPSPHSLSLTLLDGSNDHYAQPLSPLDHQAIMDQVKRMLRLSEKEEEDVKKFHGVCPEAEKLGFGRLFRNPSLFEDIVKSLLLCFCNFQQTLEMAERLCSIQERLKNDKGRKRKRVVQKGFPESWGNFPSALELATLEAKDSLIKECKLGFRASIILDFAKLVAEGRIDLLKLEQLSDVNILLKLLKKIKGFGDFVCANVLMCIGFYQIVPQDSETIRHLKENHKGRCTKKNANAIIKEIYDKFAPFQSIAYWLELVEYYERKLGKLSALERSNYKYVTGSLINKSDRRENNE